MDRSPACVLRALDAPAVRMRWLFRPGNDRMSSPFRAPLRLHVALLSIGAVAAAIGRAPPARAESGMAKVSAGGYDAQARAGGDPALIGPASAEADRAPYFPSGPLKEALGELQAGRPTRALQLTPRKPTDDPTRWLRALALRSAGRSGEARRLFEALALSGGALADRATHLAALSAIDAGESSLAEKLLGQVSLRYVDADQALLERARLQGKLHAAGPTAARLVEETLAPIFDGKVRADVASAHLIAGDAQLGAGNPDAARAHWRAAWLDHPLSGAGDSARERERRLPPRPPLPPLPRRPPGRTP